ncbi:YggT family protein [Sphingomonas baiyangensis]|uniref:YggT family protein n=1 Tax=Sphingomonas baiyangensis TaxID=2572576 RepID=A0A4U1L9P3_9SPHN|nr:YggT family protein [Sphingomonas baiyangensis]
MRCCSRSSPSRARARSSTAEASRGLARRAIVPIWRGNTPTRRAGLLTIIQILQVLLDLAWWIIIIQAVLSWLFAFNVINTGNEFVRSIWQGLQVVTEPIYRPIRRILPDFGALDVSPIVVLVLIAIIDIVLNRLAANIATGGAVPL